MNKAKPKFVTVEGVCDHFKGSKTWVYDQVQAGLLPKQVTLGPRMARWPTDEIEAVWKARTAGATCDSIRLLVADLHARRADR